jgi:hypothetical protein
MTTEQAEQTEAVLASGHAALIRSLEVMGIDADCPEYARFVATGEGFEACLSTLGIETE